LPGALALKRHDSRGGRRPR